jgi:soluble lytic murein transglycosylase-like protein
MTRTAIILLAAFFSNGALADIFRYTDSHGLVHYTNMKPAHGGFKRILQTKPNHYRSPYSSPLVFKARDFSGAKKSRFADLINLAANRHQVDPKLVHAVIQTESAYNAGAISSAGAVGLMQLMPDTARRYGVTDRRDPDQNVDGGTRYLKDLIEMFTPNLDLAVAAYNAGENAVIKHNYTIPPYPETRNYVKQVLSLYNRMSL